MARRKSAKKKSAKTLAIRAAEAAGIRFRILEYEHDPSSGSYGEEAARTLGLTPEQVFKTLVARLDSGAHVIAVIPVSRQLDLKAVAACFGAKRAAMAEAAAAQRLTGYVLGGISPLGQRQRSPTALDQSAAGLERIYVSGGRRGLEIEIEPEDLRRLCQAQFAPIAR
ncbi:MAG: Cys-tRNA(Pro) deacylase [Thermoanaerobaculia bacterium]